VNLILFPVKFVTTSVGYSGEVVVIAVKLSLTERDQPQILYAFTLNQYYVNGSSPETLYDVAVSNDPAYPFKSIHCPLDKTCKLYDKIGLSPVCSLLSGFH